MKTGAVTRRKVTGNIDIRSLRGRTLPSPSSICDFPLAVYFPSLKIGWRFLQDAVTTQ